MRFPGFEKISSDITNLHVSRKPKELKCEKQILQKGIDVITKYNLLGHLISTKQIFTLEKLKETIEEESAKSQ